MSLSEKITAVVAAIGAELKLKADAADLSTVATTGSYTDLTDTPQLNPVVVTGDVTAQAGDLLLVDLVNATTTPSLTVTLPIAPPDQTVVHLVCVAAPPDLSRGALVMAGAGESLRFDWTAGVYQLLVQGQSCIVRYVAADHAWYVEDALLAMFFQLGSGAQKIINPGSLSASGAMDATTFLRGDNTWATPDSGGGAWGEITGTLADQTDLNAALASKLNQSQVDARVAVGTAALVDQAPATLDTLNELAEALGNDPNFATTVANQIGTKADAARKVNGHPLTADVTVSKADVGLGNVDNTADSAKSVSYAASADMASRMTLATPFQVNLGSSAAYTFYDAGVPVYPGVSGALPVGNGGTGATTAAAARENIGAGTSNLTLGTSAGTACAGDDSRLADQRTPSNSSVTDAKVAANAAIALSKLATGNVVGSKSGTAANLTVWVGPQASVPTSRDANTVYLWY